jgi:hypothetical protein
MNTPDPRAEARNRANRRLRRLTIGTAAVGMASVGLLGATAAFSYDGTQATRTIALVVTGDAGSTSTDTASTAGTSTSSSATTTTPTVTSTAGTVHASTGGS